MSFLLPKRVKDLPPLEPDSEDEFKTPRKETKASSNSNKDTSMDSFGRLRMCPKRVSELPPLESDSDDDEPRNPFNCAILNDSFIVSPNRSIEEQEDVPNENNKNVLNSPKPTTTNDDSLFDHFQKLGINEKNGSTKKQPTIELQVDGKSVDLQKETFPQQQNFTQKGCITRINSFQSKSLLMPINEDKPADIVKSLSPTEAALKGTCSAPANKANDLETPFKTSSDGNFVTPQVMSFTSRPRNLTSTHQKTRSALESEFRTKKVLFQTPMAVSRPPVSACLSNDSITLSLCDTPSSADKRTENAEKKTSSKSKKSLDELFNSAPNNPKDNINESMILISREHTQSEASTNSSRNEININGKVYTIEKKLGSGGSSSVFLARCGTNNKECALKIVDLRGDAAVVEGYLNETKLLAKLQGNICVVSLYEYQLLQNESKLYMVMEKGDSDLHKILQSYKSDLPLYALMSFWFQMLQSVNYIHQNGVIHSDLKPANFLMVNGRLKIIDFGIASNIATDSTSIIKFSQAGTFNYISPEALIDTSTGNSPMRNNQPKIKISTKSDVWSLGCILYLLLYKKTPFGHIKNIYAKVNAISNPNTQIEYPKLPHYYPIMLIEMAQACLRHDPKKRLSVAELLKFPFHMILPIKS